MSLKAGILESDDREIVRVDTPEWPKSPFVFIRTMTALERDAFEDEQYRVVGKTVEFNNANHRARYLVRCLCEEDGTRIFTDADAVQLGKKSGKVLDRLYDAARKLNGQQAKDLEDAVKNSEGGPTAASTTA